MAQLEYTKHETVSLRDDPQFSETWLRDRIVEDPTILGLGELEVRDVERLQPRAGRLDLLLRDPETLKRYEVEIQLGPTDESHIIRCLEYWDIERKRYPQYDHCAVLVAEQITSRFLNIVGLFNGFIPLVAVELSALRVGNSITLHCTKVLDEMALGTEEEDEGIVGPPADRAYWEDRASRESLLLVDDCLALLREVVPDLDLKYNRYYVGLAQHGRANNFIVFRPKRKLVRIEARLADLEAWSKRLDEAGIETLEGGRGRGWLRFRIAKPDLAQHQDLVRELFAASYREQQE